MQLKLKRTCRLIENYVEHLSRYKINQKKFYCYLRPDQMNKADVKKKENLFYGFLY